MTDAQRQVFECLTGASLFQVERTPKLDETDVHLGRIVEHLGTFLASFLDKCEKRSFYFDDDSGASCCLEFSNVPTDRESMFTAGTPTRVPEPLGTGPLESWFWNFLHVRERMSDADVRATCAFMRRCLAIDPADRASAGELLQDGWLGKP